MDGIVNLRDVGLAGKAFGSAQGQTRWNALTDENEDGVINLRDIALIAKNFGSNYT